MKKLYLTIMILLGFCSYSIAQTYTPPQPKTPAATETGSGVVELATDAETVTGTATDKVTTPANITAKMSAPGAIGDTTPSTGAFTNATVTETTTAVGGRTGAYSYLTHNTNALTGELISVRGNARVDTIDSAAGTVIGGKFQAGNMGTGTDLLTATGVYVDVVNKIPSGATTWTNARGYEVSMDLDQGSAGNVNTITNSAMFYGVYNLPTVDTYATVTNGYGIFVRNEAVGGTGQMLDAAFYADDLNHSGGIHGWDYGIDFSGITSGAFGTADIRGVNGETISNNTDGAWTFVGNVGIGGVPDASKKLDVSAGAIGVDSGYRIYIDGGNNTYFVEDGADIIKVYAGGVEGLRITEATTITATVYGDLELGSNGVKLYSDITTLTTAQINALQATPISLISAQGANTIIEIESIILTYDYATAAFTVAADEDLVVEYADGTDISASIETTGFLDQVDDEVRRYINNLSDAADLEASINQAIQIKNTGAGEIADGGGELDVRIFYRVYRTGF